MTIRTSLLFIASADGYGKLRRQVVGEWNECLRCSECLIEQFVGLGMETPNFKLKQDYIGMKYIVC